ncbi:MAG: DUF1501 domain-containing protein [Bryobacterales bacterium]|nr:DUF1501 domain-containing protein [Bryobacterales bacterium]
MRPTRREVLQGALAATAGPLAPLANAQQALNGKADACIYVWLGGGAGHIDTFDPKRRGDGKDVPGSYYDSIPTAARDIRLCEHLPRLADRMDRCALLRTVSHDLNSQHGAASNLMHTGRKPSGTILYPSVGSIVSHELGSKSDDVPPYVVMGYPNIMRDAGFLGAGSGYVYLTQIETGPTGLNPAPDVDGDRQKRRQILLGRMRADYLARNDNDAVVRAKAEVSEQGFRMAGERFMDVFRLDQEASTVRESYGSDFGQRCLLARRLVQAGVRFVEVSFNLNFLNGTGWDVHQDGILKQHLLIQDLDRALSALLDDLDRHRLFDRTLVVVSTEFGRPPDFDAYGGRGHQADAFSTLFSGGAVRGGVAVGTTDEIGKTIVDTRVAVPDYFATIFAALGVDFAKNLFSNNRPVPITDQGRPVAGVLA